jgi:hypothetical protein
MKLIDMDESRRVGTLSGHRLEPRVERHTSGGEIATIFPEEICRKFAGRRVRVTRSVTYREDSPFVAWVWRGRGTLNGRRVARGDEYFVAFDAARRGVEIVNTGDERLELFTFFPVVQRGAKSNRTTRPRVH